MGQLSSSPPPPQSVELRRWTLSEAAHLRALRASLHEELTGDVLGEGESLQEVPELVALIATELATNALRHGIPPTIVRLLATDDYLILDVADHDLGSLPKLAEARPVGDGGRGLELARALSLDVGWYATGTTKNIWASFPRTERLHTAPTP
ncbi:ATP-binding protein [Micromonospora sp. C31]|uniref:ATP-binding protein n=1 Tax=Micromonospora sp. C31 TaxID=2824876 RepID=UPI001B35CB6C|nr:ATP-binding protein [Micromonospora sp. C31]MBQ1072745.1 ATP-binding protein [Micromonospora sp. C31]